MQSVPRLVIGAPHGRSGKTTITMGLVAAFRSEKGLSVQPFKKGPDFIDPGWLSRVAGRECRNLDVFLMGPDNVAASFLTHSAGVDLALVEGAEQGRVLGQVGQHPQLYLRVVRGQEQPSLGRHEGLAHLPPQLGTHGDVLEVGIAAAQPSGGKGKTGGGRRFGYGHPVV